MHPRIFRLYPPRYHLRHAEHYQHPRSTPHPLRRKVFDILPLPVERYYFDLGSMVRQQMVYNYKML